MENWFLTEKEKNFDAEWLVQNTDQFFDTVATLFKSKDEKNINKVCSKLTVLYKDQKNVAIHSVVINCIPILLKQYFTFFNDEKIGVSIEACVLTIYNLSLQDEHVKLNRIRVPNLSLPSLFHTPHAQSTQQTTELSESALQRHESELVIPERSFKPCVDNLNTEKRQKIVEFLLMLYYSRFELTTGPMGIPATHSSQLYFCRMIYALLTNVNRLQCKTQPVYLSSLTLSQMLQGLNYLFNNSSSSSSSNSSSNSSSSSEQRAMETEAYKAIDAIAKKADDELMPDVILVCNAICNQIKHSKRGTPSIVGRSGSGSADSKEETETTAGGEDETERDRDNHHHHHHQHDPVSSIKKNSQSFIRKKSTDVTNMIKGGLNALNKEKASESSAPTLASPAPAPASTSSAEIVPVFPEPHADENSATTPSSTKKDDDDDDDEQEKKKKEDDEAEPREQARRSHSENSAQNVFLEQATIAHIDSLGSLVNSNSSSSGSTSDEYPQQQKQQQNDNKQQLSTLVERF